MFWKKKDDEIKELRKEIKEIKESQEMLYKSTHMALNQYGNDIRAMIDVLIRKKIIKISKKTKEHLNQLEKHRKLQRNEKVR